MAAVSELCDRLDVIRALNAAVGPARRRDRGFGAGQLLAGIASAQLAGEDFLAGWTPARGCGRAADRASAGTELDDRRITAGQWEAVESGVAAVTQRMLELLPAPRAGSTPQDQRAAGLAFARSSGVTCPLATASAQVWSACGVTAFPATFFVSARGAILGEEFGGMTRSSLLGLIRQLCGITPHS